MAHLFWPDLCFCRGSIYWQVHESVQYPPSIRGMEGAGLPAGFAELQVPGNRPDGNREGQCTARDGIRSMTVTPTTALVGDQDSPPVSLNRLFRETGRMASVWPVHGPGGGIRCMSTQ